MNKNFDRTKINNGFLVSDADLNVKTAFYPPSFDNSTPLSVGNNDINKVGAIASKVIDGETKLFIYQGGNLWKPIASGTVINQIAPWTSAPTNKDLYRSHIVAGSELLFRSEIDGNTSEPSLSTSGFEGIQAWENKGVVSYTVWSDSITYNNGQWIIRRLSSSDQWRYYTSTIDGNIGNDPLTYPDNDTTHWKLEGFLVTPFIPGNIYKKKDLVDNGSGGVFVSAIPNNNYQLTELAPPWTKINTTDAINAWSSSTTYQKNRCVRRTFSDGATTFNFVWQSLIDGNLDIDPISDNGVNWRYVGNYKANFDGSVIYSLYDVAIGTPNTNSFVSNMDLNNYPLDTMVSSGSWTLVGIKIDDSKTSTSSTWSSTKISSAIAAIPIPDLTNYVDRTSTQSIGGNKTFTAPMVIDKTNLTITGETGFEAFSAQLGGDLIILNKSGTNQLLSISPDDGIRIKTRATGTHSGVRILSDNVTSSIDQQLPNKPGIFAMTVDLLPFEVAANKSIDFSTINNTLYPSVQAVKNELDLKIPLSQKGIATGVVPLNSSAKIDALYLPDSLFGQLRFGGTYNGATIDATTNFPELEGQPLPNSINYEGVFFIATAPFVNGGKNYVTGDWIVSLGSSWDKVANSDAVTNVFGRLGNVVAIEGDYAAFYPKLDGTNATGEWNISITGIAPWVNISGKPTTIAGYGITNAYTKIEVDSKLATGQTIGASTTGNAATATLSANSTKWNTIDLFPGTYSSGTIASGLLYNSTNSRVEFGTANHFKTFLGIPSGGETLQSVTDRGYEIFKNSTGPTFFNLRTGTSDDRNIKFGIVGGGSTFYIQAKNAAYASGQERNMALNPDGGYVGVGTITPAFPLDVAGTIATTAVGNPTVNLYSTYSDPANRNWQVISNVDNFGDFDIRYSPSQGTTPTISALKIKSTNGNATFSGDISSSGKLKISTSTSAVTPGDFGYNSSIGSYLYSKAGSLNDYTLFNNSGTAVMQVPTGTVNANFAGNLTAPTATIGTTTIGNVGNNIQSNTSHLFLRPTDASGAVIFQNPAATVTWGFVDTNGFNGNVVGNLTGGALINNNLLMNSGVTAGFTRPSITAAPRVGELMGIGASGVTDNNGLLRLSAGGGTSSINKAYIDIVGSTDVNVRGIVLKGGSSTFTLNSSGLTASTGVSLMLPSGTISTGNITATNGSFDVLNVTKTSGNDYLAFNYKNVGTGDVYGLGSLGVENNTTRQSNGGWLLPDIATNTTEVLATKNSVDLKAPLASPTLTGTPTAPTASAAANNNQIATTQWVNTALINRRKNPVGVSSGSVTVIQSASIYTFTGSASGCTLPSLSGKDGWEVIFINRASGSITFNSNTGGNDIDRAGTLSSTMTLATGDSMTMVNNGISWVVIK